MKEYVKTLPSSWYFSDKVFEQERKSIFSSEWLYAAEEHDLKKVGDYFKTEIAGYPIFLIKGEDQNIRKLFTQRMQRTPASCRLPFSVDAVQVPVRATIWGGD